MLAHALTSAALHIRSRLSPFHHRSNLCTTFRSERIARHSSHVTMPGASAQTLECRPPGQPPDWPIGEVNTRARINRFHITTRHAPPPCTRSMRRP
mmetsp:Transcript_4914/g.13060  ORF Transcript_4914/g.13060 Transcript_4914/m.13060 type:complete len:96 (-) Transcript_4914:399-686(-)